MSGKHVCTRIFRVSAILGLAAALIPIHLQAASDLEQRLRDQYKGKTFVLRGFNQGAQLTYDAGGVPDAASANPGDWTVDGFVRVTSVDVSGQRLTIKAERLYLGVVGGMGFQFWQPKPNNEKKDKKARELRIEVAVDSGGALPEAVNIALSRIFMTGQDHFAELVPDYWKPCVRAASSRRTVKNLPDCRFSAEFEAIPGIVSRPEENRGPQTADSDETAAYGEIVPGNDRTVTRAKIVQQPNPEFSEEARSTKYQGTVVLAIIVDKTGRARSIRITRPIGIGLDQKAVEAVSKWQFEPALRNGEPIAMGPIAVEVDFHLY